MDRRSPTRSLGLWMIGAYVGAWSPGTNGQDSLQYDPEWARSAQGRPLSLSLPFMPGNLPHSGPDVRAWFENLLPLKTTKYGADTPFFVTRNEVSASERQAALHHVYRLDGFRQAPKLYTLPGAVSQSCQLTAASFLALPR